MFWKKPKPNQQPEWLIVGLGNPGGEYAGTRHNVGFQVVELLAERHRIKLDKSRHKARIGVGTIGETAACVVKPLTFMNLSGQAVAPLARDYGIKPDHVLVIADDLDLPVGRLRFREGGSAGGHNGHKSLIQYLQTQDYPRIKIGIGKAGRGETIDHVLSSFGQHERPIIGTAIKSAADAVEALLSLGSQAALKSIEGHNKGKDDARDTD